jgi:hypothetical protein
LAKELETNESNLRNCVKFAKLVQENFNSEIKNFIVNYEILPGNKLIFWTYIVDNLLYESRPAPAIILVLSIWQQKL